MVIRNTIQNTIQIRIIHNTHGFPVYYATLLEPHHSMSLSCESESSDTDITKNSQKTQSGYEACKEDPRKHNTK